MCSLIWKYLHSNTISFSVRTIRINSKWPNDIIYYYYLPNLAILQKSSPLFLVRSAKASCTLCLSSSATISSSDLGGKKKINCTHKMIASADPLLENTLPAHEIGTEFFFKNT